MSIVLYPYTDALASLDAVDGLLHTEDSKAKVNAVRLALIDALRDQVQKGDLSYTPASPTLTMEEADFARQRVTPLGLSGKISAIKLVRERLGIGLKEAKDYIELWQEKNNCRY